MDFVPRTEPVEAGTPADCAVACAHLKTLGCPEAEDTQPTNGTKPKSCIEVCNNVESHGVVTLDPACVAKIQTCPEIDNCSYGDEP